MWAEGGLWSSVEDLGRWLSFQFRKDGGVREGEHPCRRGAERDAQARYLGDDTWTEAFCISWYEGRKGEVIGSSMPVA